MRTSRFAYALLGILWMLAAPMVAMPANRRTRRARGDRRSKLERMLALGVSGGQGTIALTHLLTNAQHASQQTFTFNPSAPTDGRVMLMFCWGRASDGTLSQTTTPGGTLSTTWTQIQITGQAQNRATWFRSLVSGSPSGTVTLDFGETCTDAGAVIVEVSGTDTSGTNAANTIANYEVWQSLANAAAGTLYTMTPRHANNMVLSGLIVGATSDPSITVDTGNGWTQPATAWASGGIGAIATAYKSGTSAQAPAWTWTGTFSNLGITLELRASNTDPYPITTRTSLANSTSGSGTTATSGSITTTSGSLVLLAVCTKRTGGGDALSSVSCSAIDSLTEVTSLVFGTDYRAHLWKGIGNGGSGTITFTATASQSSWAYRVSEYVGGTNRVVQTATNTATSASTLTVTLGTFANANNSTVAFFYANHGSNPGSAIFGSGFIKTDPNSNSFFTRQSAGAIVGSEFKGVPDTTADWDWAASADLAGIAVEIEAYAKTPGPAVSPSSAAHRAARARVY